MVTLTALHVLSVFIAFALTTGVGVLVARVAATHDVRAIRTTTAVARPLLMGGSIMLVLGVIFGFGTAMVAGFSLKSTWLLIVYALLVVLFALAGMHARWNLRLAQAAVSSPDDQPSAQLLAVSDEPTARILGPVTGLAWLAIIALMVFKP